MIDGVLADAVVLLHLTFVLFVVFGGLLVMRYLWFALVHAPAFVWGAYIEITGGLCPLTGVENRLRQNAGEAGYDAGFIEHYIYPVLYPPGLTRSTQLWLAAIVLGLNGAIYGLILMRRMSIRRGRTDKKPHKINRDGRA
ncbi:MAG TPA: DUF2784 domain-containing protein [Woeseiaceae bacterium]